MGTIKTIFCKFFNSVNSDSEIGLYIILIYMSSKNLSNTMFSSRKYDIILFFKKQ